MPELHEILAVESDAESLYRNMLVEAITTFTKKPDHFLGFNKTLTMFDEQEKHLEVSGAESKELVTTVDDKLDFVDGHIEKYLDIVYQKEKTNQYAKADVIVDGVFILKDAPATFLLGLETKLKKIREMYQAIPTLAPGVKWKLDELVREGVYVSETPDVKLKTAKKFDYQVLYEATDKHPAQLKEWETQAPVGEYRSTQYSGMLSPRQKAELLERVDSLIKAVKQARQRANTAPVMGSEDQIGHNLLRFIRNGSI